MSRRSYENYGGGAGHPNLTVVAGRYACQSEAERLVALDVAAKLELCPTDDLLEIGCGAGNIIVPLAFLCRSATGIDHPALLQRLSDRFSGPPAITLIPGNFLDLRPEESYSKILVYAMLHYLSSVEEVLEFVRKAAGLLRPGGRMLLGDLPNPDHKRRLLATRAGRDFEERWQTSRAAAAAVEGDLRWEGDPRLVAGFSDASIARIVREMREAGFESYLLEQRAELPFGRTREDLLIVAGER